MTHQGGGGVIQGGGGMTQGGGGMTGIQHLHMCTSVTLFLFSRLCIIKYIEW